MLNALVEIGELVNSLGSSSFNCVVVPLFFFLNAGGNEEAVSFLRARKM